MGVFITIGGVAGVDPGVGHLAGSDVGAQTRQILSNMSALLASAGSDLQHVIHVNVFLLRMGDFEEMNRIYAECMGSHRPARTVIGPQIAEKLGGGGMGVVYKGQGRISRPAQRRLIFIYRRELRNRLPELHSH